MTAVAVAWRGDDRVRRGEGGRDLPRADATRRSTRYIATREPMDKAGAYGIQGYGATIVERVDGDYFAVMGLALQRLVRAAWRELGRRATRFGAARRVATA